MAEQKLLENVKEISIILFISKMIFRLLLRLSEKKASAGAKSVS